MAAPGTVESWGRTKFCDRSSTCCSDNRVLEKGQLQHRHGRGAVIERSGAAGCPPASGGSRSGDTEVTWAVAVRISTLGWKNILMMPMPYMDWLSICSISFTVVVRMRS